MSLTNIAQQLNVSVSYISRILKKNDNYNNEKTERKEENKVKRRQQQKEVIYQNRIEKRRQAIIENQALEKRHEQAAKELSKRSTISNEALRKWCSLYCYNKKKKCYEFDTSKVAKPADFPMRISI